ncbi:hypothetical protein DFQ27_006217 [Actinomortierella ambigua]|uniref:AAA+ ATPase domain-containing protein n=1 Tax=Actinomortierella ambigua TaxID=1343610 RepID=A0A9P6PWG0_9FUNG|nr:hypothetical protein DFQ27_006217 [Actinomortierella ambigua]
MDSRSKFLELYAIKASHPQTTPLAAASQLRAVSILLSTDAHNPHLTPADRRNARALSRVYEARYDDECLWSSRLTRPSSLNIMSTTDANTAATAATTLGDGGRSGASESGTKSTSAKNATTSDQPPAQTRRGISFSSIPLGTEASPPGVMDHVRQRVDKALERKKARKGFEPAVPRMTWKEHRLDVGELLDLKCDLDMDLLPEPEAIEALVERSARLQIAVQEAASKLEPMATSTAATTPTAGLTDTVSSPMDITEDATGPDSVAEDMQQMTNRNGSNTARRATGSDKAITTSSSKPGGRSTHESTENARHHSSNRSSKYGLLAEDDDDWPPRPHDTRPPSTSAFSNGLDGVKNKKRQRADDSDDHRHADEKPCSSFITAKERLAIEEKDGNKKKFDDYTHGGTRSSGLYSGHHLSSSSNNGNGHSNNNNNTFGAVSGILKPKVHGTKRGKFRPPLNRSNSGDQENGSLGRRNGTTGGGNGSGDEVVDERLKNIEPKMIEAIKNEIMESSSNITWDDIAGLEHAKNTIMEAVIWPMLRPQLFGGLRTPPKGLLLFGPPGTGKTMIGKCIASQSNATFFNISSSSLTSKWVGDGEKMVRALFAVARCHQPAVIFIDEIDSLLTQRTDGEFEASRRIKTEFLVQFDGVGTPGEKDRILCIGATNRPQELDEAARRRFVKRLYIPLPDAQGRHSMLQRLLRDQSNDLTEEHIQEIQTLTNGYSGSDINALCREAAFGPIRSIRGDILKVDVNALRPMQLQDFKDALSQVRASVSDRDLDMYMKWEADYGSVAKS